MSTPSDTPETRAAMETELVTAQAEIERLNILANDGMNFKIESDKLRSEIERLKSVNDAAADALLRERTKLQECERAAAVSRECKKLVTGLKARCAQLEEVLSDLVSLMEGVIEGDYKPDSFTLQPAKDALSQPPSPVVPFAQWQESVAFSFKPCAHCPNELVCRDVAKCAYPTLPNAVVPKRLADRLAETLRVYAGNFPDDDLGNWQERICEDEGDKAREALEAYRAATP